MSRPRSVQAQIRRVGAPRASTPLRRLGLLVRGASLVVAALGLTTLSAACQVSREEAELRCSQLRERDNFGATCITDEAYEQCISCYTTCGTCVEVKTCPQQFSCPE
jgi:hypothetical protein